MARIGEKVFESCVSLCEINVSEGNEHYCSIDGNLYSKDRKTLIQYAIGKKAEAFAIPESVTKINSFAFGDSQNLLSIIVPNSVENIGRWAFAGCNSLTEITIPRAVKSIGRKVFVHRGKLWTVTFEDPSDWMLSYGIDADEKCHALEKFESPFQTARYICLYYCDFVWKKA